MVGGLAHVEREQAAVAKADHGIGDGGFAAKSVADAACDRPSEQRGNAVSDLAEAVPFGRVEAEPIGV